VAVSETVSGVSGDRSQRLRDVERRLLGHPAHLAYQSCFALERSIAVYSANFGELITLLEQAATDERLAVELVQNVHAPVVRERFQILVSQRLFNYLAATSTLADHTLLIMNGRTGLLADEYGRRKVTFVAHPEVPFMSRLRNFTLHYKLPFLGHTVTFDAVNTPTQTMKSDVELSAAELLQWHGWTQPAKEFIRQQGNALQLRPVVSAHHALVSAFNIWLHTELVSENAPGIAQLNELIVVRNAILAGVDMDTARGITEEWTARRAMLPESQ
jgi:hypothetical protein